MSKPPVNQPAALAPAPVAAKSSATSLVFDCLRRCLTVRLRLIALLLLAAGMLAGLGYELLNGIEAMSRSVHSLATNHLPSVDLLGRARAGFLRAHLNERTLLFQSMSTPAAAATRADHTTAIAAVDDAWRQFTAAAPEIASGAGFAAPWREWCKVSAEVITILADDTPAARRDAIDLSTSVSKDAAAVVDQALDRAIAACSAAASAQAHSAAGAATAYQRDFYRQLGIGTGIVLLLGLVIVHSVVKPLRRMVRALHECAEGQGDLTQRLPPACGEIGSLAGSFNRFVDGLRTMVASMRTTAQQVSTSSQDVTTVGQGLTTAAQSIESRLGIARSASQEVTAITAQAANSTRELSTSIHSIADSAQHLSGTAEDVGRVAVTTFNVVTEIGRDSHQVESIIGMIEAIARQTNLLALNASVEAARAGDAGAGFAVVAERVKALSIETSKATAEIRTLVGGFVGRVAATVDSIGKIKDAMVELQDRTNGIAAAVEEQSAVTREFAESFASIERASVSIAGELDAMDAVATESSRGAGAASTTATELDGASSHLSELVSRFKT